MNKLNDILNSILTQFEVNVKAVVCQYVEFKSEIHNSGLALELIPITKGVDVYQKRVSNSINLQSNEFT
tara:strand:+ start:754 stop:960 length:207 start_codon:yes stop_codon:yes gene_type:complete